MSLQHNFNVDIATEYGIEAAAVLSNLHFWVNLNRANGENFRDGKYWTYNTQDSFLKLFPYLKNRDKVKRVMASLEKSGLIERGSYNKKAYDRTTWYALTDKAMAYFEGSSAGHGKQIKKPKKQTKNPSQPSNHANGQNCPMDRAKMPNAMGKSARPIPDINTDITTDTLKDSVTVYENPDPMIKLKPQKIPDDFWQSFSDGVDVDHMRDWLAVRKLKKATNSITAFNAIAREAAKARLTTAQVIQICAENSWAGFKASFNIDKGATHAARKQITGQGNGVDKLREDFERKYRSRNTSDITTVS